MIIINKPHKKKKNPPKRDYAEMLTEMMQREGCIVTARSPQEIDKERGKERPHRNIKM